MCIRDSNIGVLTVPIEIAQQITDSMVEGGIKAVWNFTPFRIRVPANIVVQNTSCLLYTSREGLGSYPQR